MDLLMLYLGAVGVGMIGCLAAVSIRVNKVASICHIAGILFTAIYAQFRFGFLHMMTSVFTILVVGMILAYIVLKTREKRQK